MAQVVGNKVAPIGFGLMGFTWRPEPPPLEQALAALKAAVNSGLTLWNGADFYGTPEYNSMTLLKHYFTKYPEDASKITLIIKGGVNPNGHRSDGSPEFTRKNIDSIIEQLGGTKKLDIWTPGRRDQDTPIGVTIDFVQKEYIDTGKIGGIGLSEVRAETIHEAAKHAKIAAVEVELSMFSPDILHNGVAAACAQHDIPIAAYSPIGRGMLTGQFTSPADLKSKGMIASFPRFQAEAFEHNLKLVEQVKGLAEKKGCTPAQLAIGWVQSMSGRPGLPTIIPIPGATTAARVEENSKHVKLGEDEFKTISDLVSSFETAGDRYPSHVPTLT